MNNGKEIQRSLKLNFNPMSIISEDLSESQGNYITEALFREGLFVTKINVEEKRIFENPEYWVFQEFNNLKRRNLRKYV